MKLPHQCFFYLLAYRVQFVLANTCQLSSPFLDECGNVGLMWNCSGLELNDLSIEFPPELKNQNVTLDLSFNRFSSLTEETFQNISLYSDVTTIFLHHNKLSKIQSGVFNMLPNLCSLDISNCILNKSGIDEYAFVNMSKLKYLRIHQNNFQHLGYPDVSLSKLHSLEYLKIDVFHGFLFSNAFENLTNLSRVEFNIRNEFSLTNISFQGLKNSPIHSLDMGFRNHVNCDVSEDLFCSFPNLTKDVRIKFGGKCNVSVGARSLKCLQHRAIEQIDLGGNKINVATGIIILNDWLMEYLLNICISGLYLGSNGISFIKANIYNTTLWKCLEYIDLSNNDIHVFDASTIRSLFTLPKIRRVYFCCNQQTVFWNCLLSYYQLHNFTNSTAINITFPESLEILDYSENHIHDITGWNLRLSVIGKRMRGLFIQHSNVPLKLVGVLDFPILDTLNLSRNSFAGVKSDILQGVRKLQNLYLVDVKLDFISNFKLQDLLKNLFTLSIIDISSNSLNFLPRTLFNDQIKSLTIIHLDHNRFTVIPNSVEHLQNLHTLFLRYNLISKFSENDQRILKSLHNVTMYLEGNPISCACQNIQSLKWMKSHKARFMDLDKMFCVESKTAIIRLLQEEETWRKFELNCQANYWLISAVVFLTLTLFTLLIVYAVKKYRVHLEYVVLRIKNRMKWLTVQVKNDEDILYDVFLSYCDTDYPWILEHLYPKLNDLNLKVWMKDKDSIPGSWESEEIVNCINESKKVLFVVSESFVDKGWSSYAVQMAVTHALHNHLERSIIVIIKDDILLERLPNDIRNIWWCIEYFRWTGNENDEEILKRLSDMLKSV